MAGKKKTKTIVLTAEEIKTKWETEKNLKPEEKVVKLVDKNAELASQNASLAAQVATLTDKVDKRQSQAANIREFLDVTLAKYGIKAAFEPLIEMATERYPADCSVVELRNHFVLTPDQRIKIWCSILEYQLPKLKAMEVSGSIDNSITVMVRRFGEGSPEMALKQAQAQVIEQPSATVTGQQQNPVQVIEPVMEKQLIVTRKFNLWPEGKPSEQPVEEKKD